MGMDKFRNFLQSKSGPERAYKNGQKVVLRDKEGVFKVVHGEKDSK